MAVQPLRRNRDFTLFWCGQLVSTVGSRVSSVAYPLLVIGLTGSPAAAGTVAFAQGLPFILWLLPAGALVDRWERKRVMLVCDVTRVAGLAVLLAALATDRVGVPLIAAVAFVEGSSFVFFELAEAAALPRIVPPEQMTAALAQNQARVQGADLAGQPLGGVLFGLGRAWPFAVDAVSYVVSFVTLLFVRPAFQADRGDDQRHLGRDIREGVAWVWRQRVVRTLVLLIAGVNLAFNALTLVLILRAEALGASPGLIGAMLAFFGAGAIVGSIVAARIARRLPLRTVVVTSIWLWAAGIVAMAPIRWPLLLGVVAGTTGVVGPVFNVAVSTYRYRVTPDELQARSVSAVRAVAWGTIPLGGLLGGLLVEWVGAAPAFLVLGAVMLAVAVAATVVPSLRDAGTEAVP